MDVNYVMGPGTVRDPIVYFPVRLKTSENHILGELEFGVDFKIPKGKTKITKCVVPSTRGFLANTLVKILHNGSSVYVVGVWCNTPEEHISVTEVQIIEPTREEIWCRIWEYLRQKYPEESDYQFMAGAVCRFMTNFTNETLV